jgi:hypothetical protein
MADNFDMKQFLMENKLGAYSRLKENEEQLNEYEITYEYGSDGSCYRVDDEGNYDEVDDSYCKRYAGQGVREEKEETKEDMGKDLEDTEAAKQMDFLAEKDKVKEALSPEAFERMDAVTSTHAQIAMIKAAEIMMNELTEEGFEVLDIREYFTQLIANDI